MLAQRLVLGWQTQRLAQVLERLVHVEARPAGGQLEQHAAGLAEVDGVEVLAVDDLGGMRARLGNPFAPRLLLGVVLRRPRDVVDGPGSLDPPHLGRGIDHVERAALLARKAPAVVSRTLEAERTLEERHARLAVRAVRVYAGESEQGVLGRDAVRLGPQGRVREVIGEERELEPLRVVEDQQAVVAVGRGDALALQPALPEVQRLGRSHAPRQVVDHASTRAPARGARELEEGEDRPGGTALVAVVEVVDVRGVEVHGLLDQPQAEGACVEVDVRRGVGRDRGDVVDALELHEISPQFVA
jgi:hypothetical protein